MSCCVGLTQPGRSSAEQSPPVDANNVTHTQGLSILAAVRQHVSHEKGSAGLVGLKAIVSSQNEAVTAHGWPALAKQASFDHIAILDTSDQYVSISMRPACAKSSHDGQLDFGWDRLLLNAHLSNPHAFALSGRAAANLKMGNQYGPETDDVVGIFQKLSEEGKSVQELLHVRDVSFASPIMFVKDTLLSVSAKISEQWTLRPEVPVGFLFMVRRGVPVTDPVDSYVCSPAASMLSSAVSSLVWRTWKGNMERHPACLRRTIRWSWPSGIACTT